MAMAVHSGREGVWGQAEPVSGSLLGPSTGPRLTSVKWEIKCLTGRLFAKKKFDVGSAGKTKKWAPQRRL